MDACGRVLYMFVKEPAWLPRACRHLQVARRRQRGAWVGAGASPPVVCPSTVAVPSPGGRRQPPGRESQAAARAPAPRPAPSPSPQPRAALAPSRWLADDWGVRGGGGGRGGRGIGAAAARRCARYSRSRVALFSVREGSAQVNSRFDNVLNANERRDVRMPLAFDCVCAIRRSERLRSSYVRGARRDTQRHHKFL